MTHHAPPRYAPGLADAGAQVAQLRRVLALVTELAGRRQAAPDGAALDAAAQAGAAYAAAAPIDQRRFDELSAGIARWAAAGVEALLALTERGRPACAPAGRLADELEQALARLEMLLTVHRSS